MNLITKFNQSVNISLLSIGVILGAIILHGTLQTLYTTSSTKVKNQVVLSLKELLSYNGIQQKKLYLAVLGNVFDITKGSKHYVKGAPYHYFTGIFLNMPNIPVSPPNKRKLVLEEGKDGTRALVTGDFKDESENKDHILDLRCSDILTIMHWRQTFKQKYTYIGVLDGRYYDKYGIETDYMKKVKEKLKLCRIEKEESKKQEKIFPPCNMAWNERDGAKVWCTKTSGGISRNWIGVPRQLYEPGEEKLKCVCVNLISINDKTLLKEYSGCPETSPECFVNDT